MIHYLKEQIQYTSGFSIANRGDCERLSDIIFEKLKVQISYNTLRRLFDLDKKHYKPRLNTLNILSQLLGYENYLELCATFPEKNRWSSSKKIFIALGELNYSRLINILILERFRHTQFVNLFSLTIRELVFRQEFALIDKLFRDKKLALQTLTFSEKIHIGESVGSALKLATLEPEIFRRLLNNLIFTEIVILTYVDYSTLKPGQYYQNIVQEALKIPHYKHKLFFECIHYFGNYLMNKPLEKPSLRIGSTAHPILVSRVFSVRILHKISHTKSFNTDVLGLFAYKEKNQLSTNDFLYELRIVSLLTKNFRLMKYLIDESKKGITEFYQESHAQIHMLLQLIYATRNNDFKTINRIKTHLEPNKWALSYFSFLHIFYYILMYHQTDKADFKKAHLRNFREAAQELGYAKFNHSYCIHYFD